MNDLTKMETVDGYPPDPSGEVRREFTCAGAGDGMGETAELELEGPHVRHHYA